MAADTPQSTPAGVTFTAPAGWSVLPQDPAVILEPPEADSHIAVVGVQAKDSDAAAATISFTTIDPTLASFEFVMAQRKGKRALITRDGQHEYFFDEVQGEAAAAR